jgi:hypothetical protein
VTGRSRTSPTSGRRARPADARRRGDRRAWHGAAPAFVLAAIPPTSVALGARRPAHRQQRECRRVNLRHAGARTPIIVRQPTTKRSPRCHD